MRPPRTTEARLGFSEVNLTIVVLLAIIPNLVVSINVNNELPKMKKWKSDFPSPKSLQNVLYVTGNATGLNKRKQETAIIYTICNATH